MNFATVTATYEDPDGSVASGSVTLTPLADIYDGDLVTVVARPLTMTVTGGSGSAMIATTGDSPYRIDERLAGAPVLTWSCPMPSGAVDLSSLREQYLGVAFG
jgi:hypothetical protein